MVFFSVLVTVLSLIQIRLESRKERLRAGAGAAAPAALSRVAAQRRCRRFATSASGAAAVLTIDRPERRNAVDAETAELLLEGFREFEADDEARVPGAHRRGRRRRSAPAPT